VNAETALYVAFLAVGDHSRQEGLDAVDHAEDVHREHPAPIRKRQLPDGHVLQRADAGVVAEHVDRPEAANRLGLQRLHRFEAGDVRRNSDRVRAGGFQLVDCAAERRLLDVGEHDAHPLGGEPPADREADPTGAAGDDGVLSGEVLHPAALLPIPEC
jgi:hypothetical protein